MESLVRARFLLLVVGIVVVVALHLRVLRHEATTLPEPSIPASSRPLSVVVDASPDGETLRFYLTIAYRGDAPTNARIALPFVPIEGPELVDVDDAPIAGRLRKGRDAIAIEFPLERPRFDRYEVRLAFRTPLPKRTFGWGYRAVAAPWLSNLVARGTPLSIEVEAKAGTNAQGYQCGPQGATRICNTSVRTGRAPALPLEPYRDFVWKLVFATVIGAAISMILWAIWRRWTVLAVAMGGRDEDLEKGPLTLEELAEAARKAGPRPSVDGARPASGGSATDDLDPLEGVALIARGITAVLGLVAAVFLVSFFEAGLFPMPAPLALSIWAALAGALVVLAVGIDRPRPWHAIALSLGLAAVCVAPPLRFMVPGFAPLGAAILMQLTAKR